MKIVLSRKGFDSSFGGKPSPILPDGRMISLPIPEPTPNHESRLYSEINGAAGVPVDRLLQDLTGGKVRRGDRWKRFKWAHLDPDLNRDSVVGRHPDWKPVFGQWSGAQSHLAAQSVGEGDVFLFFGWFQWVRLDGERYRYDHTRKRPGGLHVCYGWLQVGKVFPVEDFGRLPAWLDRHPHLPPYGKSDHLYVATDRLELSGLQGEWPGGGVFGSYRPELCLTNDRPRSLWRLPRWFHPSEDGQRPPLTYHGPRAKGGLDHWKLQPEHVLLDSAKQGQEFVLDASHYPPAEKWLASLFVRP